MATYKNVTRLWQSTTDDEITPMCTAILFKNTGDRPLKINGGWLLQPGEETPTISTGNPEVIDTTTYTVAFDVSGGGIAPQVTALIITTTSNTSKGVNGNDCDKF